MAALYKVDALIRYIDNNVNIIQVTVEAICIFPIKSCAAIVMDREKESYCFSENGLKYDRQWMVIDAQTKLKITQRKCPKLALIKPRFDEKKRHLIITMNNDAVSVPLDGDHGDCGDEVAKLISDFIGIEARLFKNKPKLQQWDSHPLLVIFEESIASLNERIGTDRNYDYSRFRANLLCSGLTGWREERVKYMQINSCSFVCDRNYWHDGCLNVTRIDQQTASIDPDDQPKRTLKNWKQSLFGLGLRAMTGAKEGVLTVGQTVTAMW